MRRARRCGRGVLDRGSAAIDALGGRLRARFAGEPERPPVSPMAADDQVIDLTHLTDLTKAELYELARTRDIAGRSKLSKDELVEALRVDPG